MRQSLLGPMGLMSPKTPEQQAAVYSLSTLMSLAPEITFTVFNKVLHFQQFCFLIIEVVTFDLFADVLCFIFLASARTSRSSLS